MPLQTGPCSMDMRDPFVQKSREFVAVTDTVSLEQMKYQQINSLYDQVTQKQTAHNPFLLDACSQFLHAQRSQYSSLLQEQEQEQELRRQRQLAAVISSNRALETASSFARRQMNQTTNTGQTKLSGKSCDRNSLAGSSSSFPISRFSNLHPSRAASASSVISASSRGSANEGNEKKRRKSDSEASKKVSKKLEIADSLLHTSCKIFAKNPTVVGSALYFEPQSVREAKPIVCHENGSMESSFEESKGETKKTRKRRRSPATYKYAINIALQHDASLEVLDLLATAGPDVLQRKDGPDEAGTLGIALSLAVQTQGTEDTEKWMKKVVSLLLAANPKSAVVMDKYHNTPLHTATRAKGLSLQTLAQIYQANPAALHHRNFHGQKPLDVAESSTSIPEEVVDYLQQLSYGQIENHSVRSLDMLIVNWIDLTVRAPLIKR